MTTAPEQVIPLLNDYADVIVSAIEDHGGDALKLIGDLYRLRSSPPKTALHACEAVLVARSWRAKAPPN